MWVQTDNKASYCNTNVLVLFWKSEEMGNYTIEGETTTGSKVIIFSSTNKEERDEYFDRLLKSLQAQKP